MENREGDELPFPDVGVVPKPVAKFVRQPSRANRLTKTDSLVGQIILSPAEKVHFLLGGESQFDDSIEVHPLFCELEELTVGQTGEMEWSEAARWVKFEEVVETGGARWSKPRVATLTLHSIFELRSIISKGTVLLDCHAASLDGIFNQAVGKIAEEQKLDTALKDEIVSLLLHKHRHLHELRKDLPLMADKKLEARRPSMPSRSLITSPSSARFPSSPSYAAFNSDYSDEVPKKNKAFMRKIPAGSESAVLLVGEYEGLERPISAFIRLTNPQVFGDLIEVDVPTRFIFFHIGPVGSNEGNKEVGRSLATMLVDEVFHEVVYRSKNRENLLAGVDEFIDHVVALPPGEWDPEILLEPPSNVPSQESRKKPEPLQIEHVDLDKEELEYLQSQGLVRTGRIFGGLINDIKRKAPWYISDFTDAFHVQSIASITFLYFASLSPIITFGGLLGDATEDRLAAIESLIGGCLCGLFFSLFSGQPLSLLNATGPVLVFETILYNFCKNNSYYYLTVRFWVGAWMGLIMIILCALDISAWVCFITRFTEENFALLIASVYVYKAIENIIKIYHKYPLSPPEPMNITGDCFCTPSGGNFTDGNPNSEALNWTGMAANECKMLYNGTAEGPGCLEELTPYEPNVFLMSVLLAAFTFWLCVKLKHFKHELYFSYKVRCLISDFSVFICIVSMTALDWATGVATPKLSVPSTITPTWPERGWTVPIFHEDVPVWLMIACAIPAALATILLFLDQQITSVIVNRKDNLLRKGCGYHLDLFVLAFLVVLMGYCGLPWHVAGTVICLNHVDSLRKESETAAPGDKPKFFGIREQRVTHLFIFILVGLSSFMTSVLRYIPMPVLYGVFMYMGTAPLSEMDFYHRIKLFFMPAKYQPDHIYIRKIPLKRIHIFTLVQLVCFALLWVVKMTDAISICFPLMLIIMIFVRKSLDNFYTKDELRAIDAVIPPFKQNKDKKNMDFEETLSTPDAKSKANMNISEELNKSGVWTHLTQGVDNLRSRNGQFQLVPTQEPKMGTGTYTSL